jgi:hypothetical protein
VAHLEPLPFQEGRPLATVVEESTELVDESSEELISRQVLMAEEGEDDGDLPIVEFDAVSEDEATAKTGDENDINREARSVVEPPELFRLKCASHRYTADTNSTHFKRNNSLVCRVSARCNHGSTGSKQVYLARRRVYSHTTAHQLLIHRILNIITNHFKLKVVNKHC